MLLNFFPNHFSDFVKSLNLFATYTILVYELWYWIDSVHPQTASFGPERRFRSFEILEIARYACGFKIAQALL